MTRRDESLPTQNPTGASPPTENPSGANRSTEKPTDANPSTADLTDASLATENPAGADPSAADRPVRPRPSPRDWERLNAYHDGEMPPSERAAFERRLQREPALDAALRDLRQVSRDVKSLHAPPRAAQPRVTAWPDRSRAASPAWWLGAGIAATLALALLWGGARPGPERLMDLHRAYVAQDFDVLRETLRSVGLPATADQPDLSRARLTPVALRVLGDGTLAHYAGRNGCRLSYYRGQTAAVLQVGADIQTSVWATRDGIRHAVIATGMDPQRFAAIARFLQQTTRDAAREGTGARMARATDRAAPCVT